jgi:hypothetical protein
VLIKAIEYLLVSGRALGNLVHAFRPDCSTIVQDALPNENTDHGMVLPDFLEYQCVVHGPDLPHGRTPD